MKIIKLGKVKDKSRSDLCYRHKCGNCDTEFIVNYSETKRGPNGRYVDCPMCFKSCQLTSPYKTNNNYNVSLVIQSIIIIILLILVAYIEIRLLIN